MGAKKSKLTWNMKLRSGYEYNSQEDHGDNRNVVAVRGRRRARANPQPVHCRSFGFTVQPGELHSINRHANEFAIQPSDAAREIGQERKPFLTRFIGRSVNGLVQIIRLTPTVLGVMGGVHMLLEYFMQPAIQVHEITVNVAARHSWLYTTIFGDGNEQQIALQKIPIPRWWQ